MLPVHVASGSLIGCRYITQSGTYEHQYTLAIAKNADYFCPAFDLTFEAFNHVVCSDPKPVLSKKNPYRLKFLNVIFNLLGCFHQFHGFSFSATCIAFSKATSVLSWEWTAFSMRATPAFSSRVLRKKLSVKMYCTALVSDIRKDFGNSFWHTEVLLSIISHTPAIPRYLIYKERNLSQSSFISQIAPRLSQHPS